MPDDNDLLRRLRSGDAAGLAAVYHRYKEDLLTVACCLVGDRAAAEDVLHDVFVKLAGCCRELRIRTSLRAYLATSVANRARDHLRHRRLGPVCLAEVPDCPAAPADATAMLSREETQILLRAVSELPYEQREAITLHLHAGMTFREIARNQGVSINTAQSRYRYGIDKLRSTLSAGVRP